MERLVTKIVSLTKKRSKIDINYEFAFVLYKGELRKYNIVEDSIIDEKIYNEILYEILLRRAKLRCLNLLTARSYSETQLRNKLKNTYPIEIIEMAIEYVISYNYINDEKYVEDYISNNIRNKSRRQIEFDLIKKGIDKDIIDQKIASICEDSEDYEEEIISRYIIKKISKLDELTSKDSEKIVAALYRKGFSIDKVRKCIKKRVLFN